MRQRAEREGGMRYVGVILRSQRQKGGNPGAEVERDGAGFGDSAGPPLDSTGLGQRQPAQGRGNQDHSGLV